MAKDIIVEKRGAVGWITGLVTGVLALVLWTGAGYTPWADLAETP